MAAALAYYTIFSLPPLLFIITVLAGFVVGREAVEAAIQQQVQAMLGGAASGQVSTMAISAGQTIGGILGLTVSIVGVIFGATTAFAQLPAALNRSWKIRETGGTSGFIVKRILSFLVVILVAALVLASVVLNAWTASIGSVFGAEFTQVWARSTGKVLRRAQGAAPLQNVGWRDHLYRSPRYT